MFKGELRHLYWAILVALNSCWLIGFDRTLYYYYAFKVPMTEIVFLFPGNFGGTFGHQPARSPAVGVWTRYIYRSRFSRGEGRGRDAPSRGVGKRGVGGPRVGRVEWAISKKGRNFPFFRIKYI